MTQLIELSQDDYGNSVQITLYKKDDRSVENLTSVSKASIDVTRLDETAIVSDGAVTISNASSGIITFTPLATWFTEAKLDGRSHFVAIIKLTYAAGVKRSFKIPMYLHRR